MGTVIRIAADVTLEERDDLGGEWVAARCAPGDFGTGWAAHIQGFDVEHGFVRSFVNEVPAPGDEEQDAGVRWYVLGAPGFYQARGLEEDPVCWVYLGVGEAREATRHEAERHFRNDPGAPGLEDVRAAAAARDFAEAERLLMYMGDGPWRREAEREIEWRRALPDQGGMAHLEGSVAQVAWAKAIREVAARSVSRAVSGEVVVDPEDLTRAQRRLASESDARFWIRNQSELADPLSCVFTLAHVRAPE